MASKEDVLNYKPKKGIDVLWEPVKNNSSLYIVTISGSSMDGIEDNDIDNELSSLNVVSDRIRLPKDLAKIPKNAATKQADPNDAIVKEKYKEFVDKIKKDNPITDQRSISDNNTENNNNKIQTLDEG